MTAPTHVGDDPDNSGPIHRISWEAYEHFNPLLDYVWKTPRFLEREAKLETQKLGAYVGEIRAMRFMSEFQNILGYFPVFMAHSNLLVAISLFEAYALRLCRLLEELTAVELKKAKGMGRSKIFDYFGMIGISRESLDHADVVDTAHFSRNIVMHAGGAVPRVKDRDKIKTIVGERLYVSDDRRQKRSDDYNPEKISIVSENGSEYLSFDNMYSWIATAHLRNHFIELCDEGIRITMPAQ